MTSEKQRGVCRRCNRWVSDDRRGGSCEQCEEDTQDYWRNRSPMLDDCALCENKEDPRFGAYIGERRFPLCDGCGGPVDSKEKAELFAKLRTLPSVVVHACSRCGNPGDADFTTCETTWCRAFREGAKSAPMPGAAPVAEPCVDCKAAGMPEHFRAIGHTEVCAYPEHDWKRPKAGP